MEKISFDEFSEKYRVKRNPIKLTSNYENTMLDMDDEELEEVEEQNPAKVWTLTEDNNNSFILKPGNNNGFILKPGMIYNKNVIGYFICNNEWKNNKENYILV